MDYQRWFNKSFLELQHDDEFVNFFAVAEGYSGVENYYLTNELLGIDAVFDKEGELRSIHFYSEGYQNCSEFMGDLPLNLRFTLNDNQIKRLLGMPQKEGGDDHSLLYGLTPKWHKYSFDTFDLHIQYRNQGESIEMVTLMTPGLIS